MSKSPQDKKVSITGLVFTVVVTLGFIWAASQWFNRYNWPRPLSTEDIHNNEIQTFKNLHLIAQAQEKYKQADMDKDGKKNYARFFVHLWTSVDTKSEPILIELIPKNLAFAACPSEAVDGYYFIDLHRRALSGQEETKRLDYEKEWALVGVAADSGKTGFLIFITDNSGDIFSKKQEVIPSKYPYDPLSKGWTKIETIEQLRSFQKSLCQNIPIEEK